MAQYSVLEMFGDLHMGTTSSSADSGRSPADVSGNCTWMSSAGADTELAVQCLPLTGEHMVIV